MTCRCGHPFSLHMALVRGKPFLVEGSCCQWVGTNWDATKQEDYEIVCYCLEFDAR